MKTDWNDKKNDLTWKLFNAGYSQEYHPDLVTWVDYLHEFNYTHEFLKNSVWEAPCGFQKLGIFQHWEMGYMDIDWCPENDNPVFLCPLQKLNCKFNHELFRERLQCGLVECAFKLSSNCYEYENSVEMIEDECNSVQYKLRELFYKKLKGMNYCLCVHWDKNKYNWFAKYNPADCKECNNQKCVITGKSLEGKRANIFYDLKITRYRRDGGLFDGEQIIEITKGKKVFESSKPIAICQAYARVNYKDILFKEQMNLHSQLFHNPDLELEIINIRVELRESRDLLQDLQDIKAGIKVEHASDLIQRNRDLKRERRKARNDKRLKMLWRRWLENKDEYAKKILIKKGLLEGEITTEWLEFKPEPKKLQNEQITLF